MLSRWSLAEIFIAGGFAVYLVVFWLTGGAYMALDHFKRPGFLYRLRIHDDDRLGRPARTTLRRSVLVVLRNQLLGTLPALFVVYQLMIWRGLDASGPSHWTTMLWHLAVMLLVEEVLFFSAHYLLHRKWFFARIHRVHHEYRKSIGIATHYVHFIEHLVGNLLPFLAGFVITGAHPFTCFIWVTVGVINAIHTHSGYHFPWLSYSPHHDFHHYAVEGNYGVLGLLDRLFGTDREFNALGDGS